MDDLEEKVGESLRDHIVVKRIFTLTDFKDRYNAYKGTALGLSHTLTQTALWRPAHLRKRLKIYTNLAIIPIHALEFQWF